MPDHHGLDHLDHFDQGLPRMDTLPASEIRRRGDRLRRRRTALATAGGVLAAAVAIGTPVLAFSGDGGGRGTEPSFATQPTTSTPTPRTVPAGGWTTTISDDFPLLAGFADESAEVTHSLEGDPAFPAGCQSSFGAFSDSLVASYQGPDSEDRELRLLAVYPDAATAQAALSAAREAVATCRPRQTGGVTRIVDLAPADLGTEESYAFTEQVQLEDGLLSDLTLAVVGRTGNAIYVASSSGAVGGTAQVVAETDRLTVSSAIPLGALCRFSVDGC